MSTNATAASFFIIDNGRVCIGFAPNEDGTVDAPMDLVDALDKAFTNAGLGRLGAVIEAPLNFTTLAVRWGGFRGAQGDKVRQAQNDAAAVKAGAIFLDIMELAGLENGKDFFFNLTAGSAPRGSRPVCFVGASIGDAALRAAYGAGSARPSTTANGGGTDAGLEAVCAAYFQAGGDSAPPVGTPASGMIVWYRAQTAKLTAGVTAPF